MAYAGAPLETARRYWWKVRVWDEARRPSPYSAAAVFETALGADDWEAVLIGLGPATSLTSRRRATGRSTPSLLAMKPAPYFRCAFVLDKAVHIGPPLRHRARYLPGLHQRPQGRWFGTGAGLDRLRKAHAVPGLRRDWLAQPEVTTWWRRSWPTAGPAASTGKTPNAPAAHYARDPQLLLQLEMTFADGSRRRLATNDEWRSSTGAVVYADLLMGERREHQMGTTGLGPARI